MASDDERLTEIRDILREQLEIQRRIEASLAEWVRNYKSLSWISFLFGALLMVLFVAYMAWTSWQSLN